MAQPTDKSAQIDELLSLLAGKNRRSTISSNHCMTCDGPAVDFKNELSRREYSISGMCQACQDNFFGE